MSIYKVLVPILFVLLALVGILIFNLLEDKQSKEIKEEIDQASIQDRRDALKKVFK